MPVPRALSPKVRAPQSRLAWGTKNALGTKKAASGVGSSPTSGPPNPVLADRSSLVGYCLLIRFEIQQRGLVNPTPSSDRSPGSRSHSAIGRGGMPKARAKQNQRMVFKCRMIHIRWQRETGEPHLRTAEGTATSAGMRLHIPLALCLGFRGHVLTTGGSCGAAGPGSLGPSGRPRSWKVNVEGANFLDADIAQYDGKVVQCRTHLETQSTDRAPEAL